MADEDVRSILRDILAHYTDADKWVNSSFEQIKRLSNTKVGDVGQDFVERLCGRLGFTCEFPTKADGGRSRISPWDVRIEGVAFELKTATEDVKGAFQFNHIRYHRPYDALLCIGISPESVSFAAWSKADVATEKAGHLVPMDSGTSATYKLTKRAPQLRPIAEFEEGVLELIVHLTD